MKYEDLVRLLRKYGLPYATWGKGEGKDLFTLFKEVNAGETTLVEKDGKLLRRLECATVDVFYGEGSRRRYLREGGQVVNGVVRTRKRRWSLYEKRLPNEEPLTCALRGIREELGIEGGLTLVPLEAVREDCDSASFPGLRTSYVFFPFDLVLPYELYRPEGYVDRSEAPRELTFFGWS